MAKFKPIHSSSISGSLAGVTFRRSSGKGSVIQPRIYPSHRNSFIQNNYRSAFSFLSTTFKNLSIGQRAKWNRYLDSLTLFDSHNFSGFTASTLFIRCLMPVVQVNQFRSVPFPLDFTAPSEFLTYKVRLVDSFRLSYSPSTFRLEVYNSCDIDLRCCIYLSRPLSASSSYSVNRFLSYKGTTFNASAQSLSRPLVGPIALHPRFCGLLRVFPNTPPYAYCSYAEFHLPGY